MSNTLNGSDSMVESSALQQNHQYLSSKISPSESDHSHHSGLKHAIVSQVSSSTPSILAKAANINNEHHHSLPSFVDVHQFSRDTNLNSSEYHQASSLLYSVPNNQTGYWQPNFHEGSLLKHGSNMSHHNVYPSPEEKSPPTPAPSYIMGSPANHSSVSGQSTQYHNSNRNYSSATSNYHPMNVPAGYPIDQDAMVSLLFTKPNNGGNMQLETPSTYGAQASHYQNHIQSLQTSDNFYHSQQNLSSSYPSAISHQATSSYHPQSNISGSYKVHHQYQQRNMSAPLRINTRPNILMNNPNGMASSLASSARSSIDGGITSFFSSPLTESMLISNSPINGKNRKNSGNGSARRQSSKTVMSPYHLTNNLDEQPREQRLKFPGDMYTPKWVRFQGAAKEGLCDLCEGPGKWLQLKNSAFWYHKQFVHGISSVTSLPFSKPSDTRLVWMSEVIANRYCVFLASEGFCHCCSDWIPLAKNRKRHSQTLDSKEEAVALLSIAPLSIECYEPVIKAVAERKVDGDLVMPQGMKITSSMIRDLVNEPLGSTWFRHAFKCHAAAASSNNNNMASLGGISNRSISSAASGPLL